MLVTLAVLGVVFALMIRNGSDLLQEERSRSGARSTAGWLDEVRHRAMVTSARCVIEVVPSAATFRAAADNRCGPFPSHSLVAASGSEGIRLCAAVRAPHESAPPCPGSDAPLTILFTPRGTSTTNVQLLMQMPGASPDHCVQLIRPLGVLRTGRVLQGVCDWSQPI